MNVRPLGSMVFRIFHQASVKKLETAKALDQIVFGEKVNGTAGLGLESVLLDHFAFSELRFLFGEDNEEGNPAILEDLEGFTQKQVSVVPAEEVKDVIAIDGVIFAGIERHVQYGPEAVLRRQVLPYQP
jgi:hypothetical protein